jgi:hypothetical protein
VQFLFVAAPNKNSLYDENMPYYDKMKVSEERNLINLQQALTQMGVCYADLDGAFKEQDEVLYHKTDSHWNNKGAAFASGLILDTLQKSHKSYEEQEYEIREDFEGDLDQMLYPDAMTPDAEIYYINAPEFTYVEEVTSNFAPRISTVHEGGTGSLVMYRDSFGNALLPFLAEAYGEAYFSRGVPYQFSDVDTKAADCVIIERAERFLPEMAQNPPAMQAVAVEWTGEISELTADGVLDVTFGRQGNLIQMSGRILSGYLAEDTEIYIRVNGGEIYEAFPMDIKVGETTDSNGFCLYVSEETLLPEHNSFEIMVRNGEELNIVDTVESDINQES